MKLSAKAVGVSALFWIVWILVYPVCNWITSCRSDVHCFYFEWEHHVPFVPLLIIPYLSIDIFLVLAPFLPGPAHELQTYCRRIVTATLIGGACFLLFPMSFGWQRPPVDGVLGIIFRIFRGMDLPFNQCPSLHAAFLMIMLDHFIRNTRGALRIGIILWFLLILVSTVFTYQHHCMDIVGGFALGGMCFYLFRQQTDAAIPEPAQNQLALSQSYS